MPGESHISLFPWFSLSFSLLEMRNCCPEFTRPLQPRHFDGPSLPCIIRGKSNVQFIVRRLFDIFSIQIMLQNKWIWWAEQWKRIGSHANRSKARERARFMILVSCRVGKMVGKCTKIAFRKGCSARCRRYQTLGLGAAGSGGRGGEWASVCCNIDGCSQCSTGKMYTKLFVAILNLHKFIVLQYYSHH